MNQLKSPIFLILSFIALLLVGTTTNHRLTQAANAVTLTYDINRSAVPAVNDNELTLIINTANATQIAVTDQTGATIPHKAGPAADEITVTTVSDQINVELADVDSDEDMGAFRKAGLKDNHAWAYSHGFDDNYFLEEETAVFLDRGIPAGFNLVTRWIIDPAAPWEGDFQAAELNTLIDAGWAINNHSTDHEDSCHASYDRASRKADVLLAQDELRALLAASSKPNMLILGYTVPCGGIEQFNDYPGIIREIRDNGEDTLLYTDGIFQMPFNVDVSPPYDFEALIRRDSRIDGSGGSASTITAEMDTTSQLAAESGKPHWYTTFSHGDHLFGDNVNALATTVDYLINTYGTNGTNEVWIAPTSVVYSYLLVRDKSVVTRQGEPAETATPTIMPTNAPTAVNTPTLIPTGQPNPTTTPLPEATATQPSAQTPAASPTSNPFPIFTSTPINTEKSAFLYLPFNRK